MLRNFFFSEHRKRRREVEDADGHLSAQLAVAPGATRAYVHDGLPVVLLRPPSHQREALVLVGAEGFSYEEAAAISGFAVGTTKSRVNRARVRLTELLGLSIDDYGPDRLAEAVIAHGAVSRRR
jgi:RNA polymerase sigma-70 factor, ECF subfamily